MTESEIMKVVFELLKKAAPDAEPENLGQDDPVREKLDMDSFDFLRFLVSLDEKTGISIPEEDYSKVTTLRELVSYIKARVS